MNSSPYLVGQFLLAMPGIGDPRFERSVIAMCAHDPAGALGICLHAELDGLTMPDLMRQLDIDPLDTPDRPLLFGGPVEPQRGFVLHTPDFAGQDTRFVAGRWALTGTRDVLVAIAEGKGPSRWVAALGYAGWSEGQLERELAGHGWHAVPGTTALLFETEAGDRWARAFGEAGINPGMLAGMSGRA